MSKVPGAEPHEGSDMMISPAAGIGANDPDLARMGLEEARRVVLGLDAPDLSDARHSRHSTLIEDAER